MISYPHVAQRIFNTPLAISKQKAEIIIAVLRERFDIAQLVSSEGPVALASLDDSNEPEAVSRPYEILAGIAVIPVSGTLVHKLGTLRPYSGMTGYDGIRANLSMALADSSVKAIALDIDSPGGEVSGCFDLVDEIYEARGEKPIWSILSESAYSAAYAIASATDRIVVPRTGGTGSVGVICLHADFSKALDKAGIAVTLIQYGARKADGNEFQPISDEVLSRFQSDVDAMGDLFVETVARNRKISAKAVRSTEAGTFLGETGVSLGFADAVMSPDAALAALFAEIS